MWQTEKDYVTSLRHQLTAPSGNTLLYLSFSVYVRSSFQRPMGPTVINQFLVILLPRAHAQGVK